MDYLNNEHYKITKEYYDKLKNQYLKRSKIEGFKDGPEDESFHNYVWQELLSLQYDIFSSLEDGEYNENIVYASYADYIKDFFGNHDSQKVVRDMNNIYEQDKRFR
ncbi:hypothetical protein [Staphylococcus nepalensis]|uniref:hypothetical protein n=1 Tax=Staphylococcus nepalensis TaxID=214473 RepID=UPI0031BACFA5